jgi:FkbM family methyltransferase
VTETLDDFVAEANINKNDFIKVDIEGAEYLFFKGAKKVLTELKPKILFESYEGHCKSVRFSRYRCNWYSFKI